MTTTMDDSTSAVFDTLQQTRDAMSVGRVFGEPSEHDGATYIPVARIAGGAGGGGGSGTDEDDGSGSGFGSGFRLGASPVGMYEIRNGSVEWKPAVDVTRIARGGQILAGVVVVCATLVLLRRR